jgi:hypothetical protein
MRGNVHRASTNQGATQDSSQIPLPLLVVAVGCLCMDAVNTNPLSFRLAAAYGATPKARATTPTAPAAPTSITPTQADRVDASLTRIRPLVAATVPGKIDFSAGAPQQTSGAMPMYRHPYDKNAAATGVASGKAIDVTG